MASVKRIKKDLVKLSEEDLKDVLSFLAEDEQEEVVVEKVEDDKKEEKKEEPQKDEKEQPQIISLSKEDLQGLLDGILSNYATKKEVEDKVDKVQKKAKPFGADKKKESVEHNEQPSLESYLDKINSQFV